MAKKERIEELVDILNIASEAYYGGQDEIITNAEWDKLFNELTALEKETGYVLPNSPTINTSSETNKSNREPHEYPALSLDKTQNPDDVIKWAASHAVCISWKCDGLTLVATYDGGKLSKLLTRGDGTTGRNITFLAPYIKGLPGTIGYKGHLVVRGEAMISYPDFNKVNDTLSDNEKYQNPRNLAAGTLNLDETRAAEVGERGVFFTAFNPVHFDEDQTHAFEDILVFNTDSYLERMTTLDSLGFHTVEREYLYDPKGIPSMIEEWTNKVKALDFPVDGLVFCFENFALRKTGSVTGHHITNEGFAFKWKDEAKKTVLRKIEWQVAAQSISPVAVFDPIEIEGTTVQRATLHNINFMESKKLGIGDEISVIKANMIIPQVVENYTQSNSFTIPDKCPECGAETKIEISDTGTKTLVCTNPDCKAKLLRKFTRFVDRDGFDIEGLSEGTLKTLIDIGLLTEYADLWKLKNYKETLVNTDGFGEKSYNNLVSEIESKRNPDPVHFMYALNIPLWGRDATKRVCKAIGSAKMFENLANNVTFSDIEGIGEEKNRALFTWWNTPVNQDIVKHLMETITVSEIMPEDNNKTMSGLTFVITGDVHQFKNRDAFKAYVEANGGKVAGSISKKTDYLVNNDIESQSSKNKKAKELGIPIISEDHFVKVYGFPSN